MPHMIRFSIMNQGDINASLAVCHRLGLTPDEFAKSAFFESLNTAIKLINDRDEQDKQEKMSAEAKAQAEKDLGIATPEENANGQSESGNIEGDSPAALVSEDASTSVLADPPADATDAG